MAKRSPILGYNHNVRYRGLVFHVQTEDSGLLSPHLFTHLFHGGVIISTRKLVYDAGAAEDAIKSLMQAQHKAVLKDLKKGSFDDKIDQYLGGTPGLLPRGVEDEGADRPSDPQLARASEPVMAAPPPKPAAPAAPATPRPTPDADVAFELAPPGSPAAKLANTRTRTAERGSAPTAVRTNLPPPAPSIDELGGPTLDDHEAASVAAAIAAANATIPTRVPTNDSTVPMQVPPEMASIEIELELDEPTQQPQRQRPRDTDIASSPELELGRPSPVKRPGESVPPLPPPPHAPRSSSSLGAAALPPKVPPSRMPSRPAITPPQVVSRPLSADRRNEDAVEVYAPPPPGADAPPGASERPGQYSQHKRISTKVPVVDTFKERSGSIPVPPGLGRPGRISSSPSTGVPKPVGRDSSSNSVPKSGQTGANPVVPAVPANARDQSSGAQRARTPTPSRAAPATSRTASSSGGVVMTRPAVIVGAPAKPNQPSRVRKAREDEGRGFGQGLISEKSLDEVILAYLSEDADEK